MGVVVCYCAISVVVVCGISSEGVAFEATFRTSVHNPGDTKLCTDVHNVAWNGPWREEIMQ